MLVWHVFWHIFWHSFLTYFLAFFSGSWGPVLPAPLGSSPVVRCCPLRSGAPRLSPALPTPLATCWGPALPTAIWSSPLRTGAAHSPFELPVEVRRCPLQQTVGEDDSKAGAKRRTTRRRRGPLLSNLTTLTWQVWRNNQNFKPGGKPQ